MRPCATKKTVFLIAFAGIIIGGGIYGFRNLGAWLVVSDPLPSSLDVFFTLGGEDSRLVYSQELYARYPRAIWLISYPSAAISRALKKEGFDTSRIAVVDTCQNTRSEIAFLSQRLSLAFPHLFRPAALKAATTGDSDDSLKIGIISNWYHMRRIKVIVDRQLPKGAYSLYYLPASIATDPYRYSYKKWWRKKVVRSIVFLEWEKILLYLVRHV
jgi:uncharacterized SAM-binding protein YcdF (DUF218 family)